MPTISQLVRKGREKQQKKVKTPAFRVVSTGPKPGHPDLPNRTFEVAGNPQRRGVCTQYSGTHTKAAEPRRSGRNLRSIPCAEESVNARGRRPRRRARLSNTVSA